MRILSCLYCKLRDAARREGANNGHRFQQSIMLIVLIAHCLVAANAMSAANVLDEVPTQPGEEETEKFVYELNNRPDPFVPFFSEKSASSSVDMSEIVDSEEPLTGMQLFEPGQLNLVALLKIDQENLAMVEDFTGKGYVLGVGMKIGKRGIVRDIALNSVTIEETAKTRAGKEIVTEIVMMLKKEGEE